MRRTRTSNKIKGCPKIPKACECAFTGIQAQPEQIDYCRNCGAIYYQVTENESLVDKKEK